MDRELSRRTAFGPTGASRPDWFITGFRQEDKFVVLGSRSLQQASLQVQYESMLDVEASNAFGRLIHDRTVGQYTFTAITNPTGAGRHEEGEVLAMAWGADYAEALQRLFEVWSPAGGDPLAIGEGG